MSDTQASPEDLQKVERLQQAYAKMKAETAKVIVGQDQVVDELFMALFCRGHCLLIGVPGLAKTLMISTLARVLSLSFNRIQFTPDLMPSDITGTEVLQEDKTTGGRAFKFLPGPIFANVILADEINRTPPKTQAALLESMQEYQVTVGGQRHDLDRPFFVLATQNPIEQEGTYPLPEAQLDRFMLQIVVDYPDEASERQIVALGTTDNVELSPVLTPVQLMAHQELVRRIPVPPSVVDHVVALLRASRPGEGCPTAVAEFVRWGAGPRAGQQLISASQARAALDGRPAVNIEDVRELAGPVLEHRLVRSFAAESRGVSSREILDAILEAVPA